MRRPLWLLGSLFVVAFPFSAISDPPGQEKEKSEQREFTRLWADLAGADAALASASADQTIKLWDATPLDGESK